MGKGSDTVRSARRWDRCPPIAAWPGLPNAISQPCPSIVSEVGLEMAPSHQWTAVGVGLGVRREDRWELAGK